jgi:hypothetical protein
VEVDHEGLPDADAWAQVADKRAQLERWAKGTANEGIRLRHDMAFEELALFRRQRSTSTKKIGAPWRPAWSAARPISCSGPRQGFGSGSCIEPLPRGQAAMRYR